MAIRPILPITDPLLRQKSAEIEAIDDSVRDLVSDMLETMQDADGAGLAAVQIGELRRILVADIPLDEPHASHKVFINPEIIWQSDEIQELEGEGCLSMPEIYFKVPRALEVKVRFTDLDAVTHEVHAEGFSAVCFQHEIDHLNGIRQIDHVSSLKRDKFLAKFRKYLRIDEYGQRLWRSA